MNYYERYCGDYQRDTAHLSLAEHGAYTMMLDTYFSVEKPLPEDFSSLYRVCRAMSRLEQQAVRAVAEQFFPISPDDGLRHNQRADREIAKARPKIEAARINGKKGGRPPRAAVSGNTAEVRQVQTGGGDIPNGLSVGCDYETGKMANRLPWSEPGSEAHHHQPQHLYQPQHSYQSRHGPRQQPGQAQEKTSAESMPWEGSGAAKARSQPDSAPDQDDQFPHRANSTGSADAAGAAQAVSPGISGACCNALMSQGITGCNPHHPTLLALLQAGATEEEFVQAARNAAARGKASFPYVVGTVKRQREEAAKLVLHEGRMPNRQELLEAANHASTAGWVPPELREAEPGEPGEVEPVEAGGRLSPCR